MRIGSWPERISRLIILEELAVAYWRHRKRETRWYEDFWCWYIYDAQSPYEPGETAHMGPLFRAVESGSSAGGGGQQHE